MIELLLLGGNKGRAGHSSFGIITDVSTVGDPFSLL